MIEANISYNLSDYERWKIMKKEFELMREELDRFISEKNRSLSDPAVVKKALKLEKFAKKNSQVV